MSTRTPGPLRHPSAAAGSAAWAADTPAATAVGPADRFGGRRSLLLLAFVAGLEGCATPRTAPDLPTLAEQVRATEADFARSMAERRFDAFAAHVAEDAVFVNGGQPLRGKAAVLAHWQSYFERPAAPFAWKPEIVEVLASGTLAYSEGPVSQPDGKTVARFFSTWRREGDGRWRVVFDNGYNLCNCPKP
jgi:ketosteroid isomerase-like protein